MSSSQSNITSSLKKGVRKILPVRSSVFERRLNRVEKELRSLQDGSEAIRRELSDHQSRLSETNHAIQSTENTANQLLGASAEIAVSLSALHQSLSALSQEADTLKTRIEEIDRKAGQHNSIANRLEALQRETIWGQTFQQVISTPAEWLKDTSFAPGRWAVGFPFLYALYRILNEMKPRRILELGLGQTTKMIGQYAVHHRTVQHTVVEHDKEWVDFWRQSNRKLDNTEIMTLELVCKPNPNASHDVRQYDRFAESLFGNTYDFISIDAPFGYDMKELARIDVLSLIPACLDESFAIMVDDYNRRGEQNMVRLLEKQLIEAGVKYATGAYKGEKHTLVIASQDNAFLCSM